MDSRFAGIDDIGKNDTYHEGYQADRKGISRFDCPYKEDYAKSHLWLMGWHDARINGFKAQVAYEARLKEDILELIEKYKT